MLGPHRGPLLLCTLLQVLGQRKQRLHPRWRLWVVLEGTLLPSPGEDRFGLWSGIAVVILRLDSGRGGALEKPVLGPQLHGW